MKRKINNIYTPFTSMLALLLLFGSCLDDRYDSSRDKQGEGFYYTLTLNLPENNSSATRALSQEAENILETVDILVFLDHMNGQETFLYHTTATEIDNDSHLTQKTCKAELKNSNGMRHRLYILANLRDEIDPIKDILDEEMTLTEVFDLINFDASSVWNTSASYRKLPMSGCNAQSVVIAGEGKDNPIQLPIPLIRAVARVDVVLNMGGSGTPQGFPDDLFYLTDTYIYNAMDSARAMPYNENYETSEKKKVENPSIPPYAQRQSDPIEYTLATKGNGMIREIYMAESDNNSTGITFEELSCLVIGGHYKGSQEKSWYRIDFFDKTAADTLNTWQDILRNHRYLINITSVDGKGYTDPGTAFKSKQIDIQTQILRWEEGYYSDVVYDDKQNYLKVNKGKWEFPMDAVVSAGSNNILTVETSWPDGWIIDRFTDEEGTPVNWLSTSVSSGASGIETEVPILLTVNDSGKPRTGYIHLKAGNLTYLVEVYQLSFSIKYDCLYPLNGEIHTLMIKTVNGWTATLTTGDGVVNTLLTSSGAGNIAGETIRFRTNKVDTPYEGTDFLTITSPDFDPIEIPLRCGTGNIVSSSNSYIIKPGAMGIRIPVSRANEYTTLQGEADAISSSDILTAELVWTDNRNGISCESNIASVGTMGVGNTGYIQVWPGSAEGNALVAVRVNGTIKWSWHIWVTNYDPAIYGSTISHYNSYPSSPKMFVFMDRNLGAISNTPGDTKSMGLHYQWSRKDPFPGGYIYGSEEAQPVYNAIGELEPVPSSITSVLNDLSYNIENPTEFTQGFSSGHMLWGERNETEKTIYDPCPEGWRVPNTEGSRSPWYSHEIGYFSWIEKYGAFWNYGLVFLEDIYPLGYYPAAGVRTGQRVQLVGAMGRYWTSLGNGIAGAWLMELVSDDYDHSAFGDCNYGCSVRCIKEDE